MSDWTDYESGPFCRHWSSPYDCERKCANCGHACVSHGEDGCESHDEDGCESCDCEEWVEPEPSKET